MSGIWNCILQYPLQHTLHLMCVCTWTNHGPFVRAQVARLGSKCLCQLICFTNLRHQLSKITEISEGSLKLGWDKDWEQGTEVSLNESEGWRDSSHEDEDASMPYALQKTIPLKKRRNSWLKVREGDTKVPSLWASDTQNCEEKYTFWWSKL